MRIIFDVPDNVVRELKGSFQQIPDSMIETSLKIGFMNTTKDIYANQKETIKWAEDYLNSNDVKSAMVDILKIAAELIERES